MASITELWIDNFENATVDLDVNAGNGYVSEPAGSSLLVGCNAGQSCDAWTAQDAPFATTDLQAAIDYGGGDPAAGLIIIESRLIAFTEAIECINYMVLDFTELDGFWFGYYPTNDNMYVQGRQGGAAGVTFWNGGTYSSPNTPPRHRYRIVCNFSGSAHRIPDVASQYKLNPGDVAFVVSTSDGVNWAWLHTRNLHEINPGPGDPSDYRIGFMCRNWGAFPAMEAEVDYLRVLQTTGDIERDIPHEPRESEDEVGFTDLEKPEYHAGIKVTTSPATALSRGPEVAGASIESGSGGQPDHLMSVLADEHQGGGVWVPEPAKQAPKVAGDATRRRDEVGFRDADNAGVDSSEQPDDAGKALIVGFGAAGPPRYFWPHRAPTEDKRHGGRGARQPGKHGSPPYPTDGRVLGSSLQLNTRRYGIDYGAYDYPAKVNEPHFSQTEFFDADERWLANPTDYTINTIDQYGRPHFGFGDARVVDYFVYDTTGELWTTPTDPSFTGYARDGKYYVNGIDQGSQAPWALETPSDNRGGRSDFPERALVVVGRNEVVIFDLIAYPTHLNMWMRFRIGQDSGNYWMLGRGSSTLRSACMKDGIMLVAGQQTPWEVGRLFLVNFKATNENCAHLIGGDNHWFWLAPNDITQRHTTGLWTTTGPSPSLRSFSEYNRNVDVHQVGDTLHFVATGEDNQDPIIIEVDSPSGVPQIVHQAYGEDIGGVNDEELHPRCAMFDAQGMLWHSNEEIVWRNGFDYQQGVLFCSTNFGSQKFARLPARIRQIADDGAYLWLGTDIGVFKLHKGTMSWRLAYGIAGSGAGGRLAVTGAGELVPGSIARCSGMQIARLQESSFLSVSTGPLEGGGAALIRLYDDAVLDSKLWPTLDEYGAYSHGVVFG